MKLIKLTQGQFAQVDDEDYDYLNQFKWCTQKNRNTYYAVRAIHMNGKKCKVIMHRVILELKDSKILVDHIDRNGLNNQRNNLRSCNNSQNQMNKRSKGISKYLGVSLQNYKSTSKNTPELIYNKWHAAISPNKKRISLGLYPFTPEGEILAAKAYDQAAKEHYGEFANLNFKE